MTARPPAAPGRPDALPTAEDLRRLAAGRHDRLWEVLGSRPVSDGVAFAVWAPAARQVAVVGTWNGWDPSAHPLRRIDGSGVWAAVVPGVAAGALYKYAVTGADGATTIRVDPLAQAAELGGERASIVFESGHEWGDDGWLSRRAALDWSADRLSTYEVHLGSWRRHADGSWLTYREIGPLLAEHVTRLGFTHVELLPVAEHPFDPSWGYQVTSYYAPTARFGSPDDFRWLVDHLHQAGIGVLVDWVPAHFPKDEWALARFDGSELYEHEDPARAEHPDWGTLEFDVTKPEVRAFLLANARYWLDELHVDGLRVDAVASMLYLDYSRGPGEWTPNVHGGNQDLDVVAFLQELSVVVADARPGALLIAEESTAWDGVTRAASEGGLGFTHKWNLGWMHDTLDYWSAPPADRPGRHHRLTFGLTYAWAERFVLPLSHDEVVHLKRPLLGKMPGTGPEPFDHLRCLFAWMWAHPGKELLFMGAELAEDREWSQDRELDWARLEQPGPAGVCALIAALNAAQAVHPALHRGDGTPAGFQWVLVDDAAGCTFAFTRHDPSSGAVVLCAANLSDEPHLGRALRVPVAGPWRLLLSTDDPAFGGSGHAVRAVEAGDVDGAIVAHVDLPARTVCYLEPDGA